MAGRFRFRFETILRLRRQKEDLQKRVVAARVRQIQQLQERHALLTTRIAQEGEALRGQLREGMVDVDALRSARHWLVRLRQGVLQTDAEIAAHRAILAQERVALVESRKEAEVMSRLRLRQEETFIAQLEREEQLETDDLNTMRFARWAQREGDE
ncbi:MAG TPA: flagellar export protein FliJ [Phycisphaerae bacterium]|nr:flagellar export protein FliJ [Phycisphaerae bacterium]